MTLDLGWRRWASLLPSWSSGSSPEKWRKSCEPYKVVVGVKRADVCKTHSLGPGIQEMLGKYGLLSLNLKPLIKNRFGKVSMAWRAE